MKKSTFGKVLLLCSFSFFLFFISLVSASYGFDNSQSSFGYNNLIKQQIISSQNISGNFTNFTDLLDTPDSYLGEGLKCLRVNSAEDRLEFFICPSGGGGGNVDSVTSGDDFLVFNPTTGNVVGTINETALDNLINSLLNNQFVPYVGAIDNIDLNEVELTNVGLLLMEGNIIPRLETFNLGNSTNRFGEIYAIDGFFDNLESDNISSNFINSNNINSSEVKSTNVNISDNLSIGGFEVKKEDDALIIILG